MKKTIFSFALLFLAFPLMAQNKKNISFFKENGVQVSTQDSTTYIRIIEKSDSSKNSFVLKEFYPNGKLKTLGNISSFEPTLKYEGNLATYRLNGTIESNVNYKNGNKIGFAFYFFENRQVKKEVEYLANPSQQPMFSNFDYSNFKLISQFDSLGNAQVKDGNGYVKEVNFIDGEMFFEEGKYTNGFKDSLWVGHYASGKSSYQEIYVNGKLTAGKNKILDVVYNYTIANNPPKYKGGIENFYRFIGENMRFPEEAARFNLQGTVIVSFTINKEGNIEDVEIIKSVGPSLDQEATRILLLSPKWVPGSLKGVPVRVRYDIPISFKLSG
jgi:TonB family protein